MEKIEQFDQLLKLENSYLIKMIGTTDFDEREKFTKYRELFPEWWFYSLDYSLQINMLKIAVEDNKRLSEIEDNYKTNCHKSLNIINKKDV